MHLRNINTSPTIHVTQQPLTTDMLKIGLIGYGRMGQMIEKLAEAHQAIIIWKIESSTAHLLTSSLLQSADVVIEITSPDAAPHHVRACLEAGVPVVTGTTGWQKALPEAYQLCDTLNGTMLYASNFSVGVNLFFAFNRFVAEKMAHIGLYQPEIAEWHHIYKKDAPSGTAVTIAEGIMGADAQYQNWQLVDESHTGAPQAPAHIPIHAYREGEIVGTHTVTWSSDVDEISIRHQANDRTGFAVGALLAARYIWNKKGVLSMRDVLGLG
jgi:4-hydroxy-tetrahydrodipicolinate reductase